jgi:hypothetical protein
MGGPEPVVVAEAGAAAEDGRMEGWLYLIRSNRLGLQTSRKRYFVLEDSALRCFKAAPPPSTSGATLEVPCSNPRPPVLCSRLAFFSGEFPRHFRGSARSWGASAARRVLIADFAPTVILGRVQTSEDPLTRIRIQRWYQ